ncbi:MAG: thioesterase family protein [Chloroflexota bacterium]
MPPFGQIPIEQITQLPLLHRATITDDYLDAMGHMNVRWYLALFDEAGWRLFEQFGMDMAYYQQNAAGAFALQHIIRYLAEVHAGDTVAIYGRLLGRTDKRIHVMCFMVNETQGLLAATIEELGSHADLTARRTAPMPPDITDRLDAVIAAHSALDWDAPISGAIKLK